MSDTDDCRGCGGDPWSCNCCMHCESNPCACTPARPLPSEIRPDLYPEITGAPTIEHETGDVECWCGPTFRLPCNECEGEGCWKCTDGTIAITRDEALAHPAPVIVVHVAAEGE